MNCLLVLYPWVLYFYILNMEYGHIGTPSDTALSLNKANTFRHGLVSLIVSIEMLSLDEISFQLSFPGLALSK